LADGVPGTLEQGEVVRAGVALDGLLEFA